MLKSHSLALRWKNVSGTLRFHYGRALYRSPIVRFLERRYRNNISTWHYHYARFRYRYFPGYDVRSGLLGLPVYLLMNRLFHKDWNQLMHFAHYAPRPIKCEPLPSLSRPAPLRIGLVTPSYNQRQFVEHTMLSVLGQNHPRLQYAVVDGGSTDGSADLIARYRDRLTYTVSEKDNGQSDALVKGFARIEADILGYLNSDDLLTPGSLAFVTDYFARNPDVDVIYSHRIIIDDQGHEVGRWILPPHDEHSLRRVDYIPQETLFWRRELFEKVGGIDRSFQYAMDWDLILKFMDAGARFRRLPCFLGCFRTHPVQKTGSLWLTVGEKEVTSLRRRQGIAETEVHEAVFKYRRAAAFQSIAWRLGSALK